MYAPLFLVADYALGCAAVTVTKGAFPPYGLAIIHI